MKINFLYIIIQVRLLFYFNFLDINVNKLSSETYKFIAEKMMEISKGNLRTTKDKLHE
jgi:hypothetical protein